MPIKAEMIMCAGDPAQFPKDHLPEIAMVGRSNVGKSSLINRLLGVRGLARTSNTPGRTQTINFYRITPDAQRARPFYLVDMPGYGYAAVNTERRRLWGRLIDDYLSTRETLRGSIQLIDLRHSPQPLDLEMTAWLQHFKHTFLVVGTKADKIAKTRIDESLLRIAEDLHIDSRELLAFSAETGYGRDALWRWVLDTVG